MISAAGAAQAYEYPLQFTPVGDVQSLVVAGYEIVGKTVVGNCSYVQVTSGSGRDPRSYYTPINQTCVWSLYGDLVSVTSGEPAVPAPLATAGTETIYARKSASLYAGADSAFHGGFVFLKGAHYVWDTSDSYMVLDTPAPYTFTATVGSDGDIPLNVAAVHATVRTAKVKIESTTCKGSIPTGATCDITVTYDPSKLTSPTGLAYDTLTLKLSSNAGQIVEFVQSYTIVVPVPPDDGLKAPSRAAH
jgi:hypothetical protein